MTVSWEGDRFVEAEGQGFLQIFQGAVQVAAAGKAVPDQVSPLTSRNLAEDNDRDD